MCICRVTKLDALGATLGIFSLEEEDVEWCGWEVIIA